ncbi:hypothetical protein Tco_0686395, partial [Tanacetum coccineum]
LRKKYRLRLKNDMPPRDKLIWTTPTLLWRSISDLRKKKLVGVVRCITRRLLRTHSRVNPRISLNVDNLKTDSENDNDKVNMPSFPSPKPTVSYFDDLDYFKDFKKEISAIFYNDALMSKLYFLTEPTISPQHINEFDLKRETSLSECDGEEQNILYFNDLFPINIICPDDSKLDKDNADDKIDIKQSSRGINTAYHGDLAEKKSMKLLKYRSSEILCVIVVMLAFRRIYNTHPCS